MSENHAQSVRVEVSDVVDIFLFRFSSFCLHGFESIERMAVRVSK